MKICFIGDRKGKVHSNRFRIFNKYINHDFEFFSAKDKKIPTAKFDLVYYASISLYLTRPVDHPCILGSATSWKCVNNKDSKKIIRHFGKFKRISANNNKLCNALKVHRDDIVYLPNGVEVDFFTPVDIGFDPKNIRIGWVGNKNRSEKNYYNIVVPVQKRTKKCIQFDLIATEKSSSTEDMLNSSQMRDYYQKLHFYWVSSSFEGTPNPALEAGSCGVPLISTRVGNMPEIIVEGKNGFFVECNEDNMVTAMNLLRHISPENYQSMRLDIRSTIKTNWSWKNACIGFRDFFEGAT